MANRAQQIRQGLAPAKPRGSSSGVGQAHKVPPGQWAPKGESKNTAFAKGAFSGGGGGGNPAAAAPGPAAAPTAQPWDSAASNDDAASWRKYETSTGGNTSQWDIRQRQYGLDPGYSNPYSEAALLQRQHDQGHRGVLNSANNRIYGGTTINKLAGEQFHADKAQKDLEFQHEADAAAFAQRQKEARDLYDEEHGNHLQEAADRQSETDPEPEAAPAGGGGGGSGSKPKSKPKAKPKQNQGNGPVAGRNKAR